MKAKTKQSLIAVGIVVVIFLALAGIKGAQIFAMINAGKSFKMPPEAVSTSKVAPGQWQPLIPSIGTLVAVQGLTLAAELPGTVRQIEFESGATARKGQILVRFDTSTEEAQLASAQAETTLAKIRLDRVRKLREANASTQADLDAAEAQATQAEAMVASVQSAIDKKTVRAPFDGKLGIRQVEVGQVVAAGAPIASLSSVDPIYAEFWLPQQSIAAISAGQAVEVQSDTFVGETWKGKISVVNPDVDPSTRNVKVRALLPNADARLRPGMFVTVNVLPEAQENVLTIVGTAILHATYGDSVFVVERQKDDAGKETLVAKQKFVRLGERRGDMVAVLSGIDAGDTVVTSGAFRLRNGAELVVNNDLAPQGNTAPKLADK